MTMEKFHAKLKTGKVNEDGTPKEVPLELPKFDQIPFGTIRKLRKLPTTEQFFALLEKVIPEDAMELLDETPQKEVNRILTEWQKDSGVELGESTAS